MRTRLLSLLATGALLLGATACGSAPATPRALPTGLVPNSVGELTFKREPKAEAVWSKRKMPKNSLISSGQIFTVRSGTTIEGDLQLAVFKPSTDTTDLTDAYDVKCAKTPKRCSGHQALLGMNGTLGDSVPFRRLYVGDQRVYVKVMSDLRMYLWFPPRTQSYVLLVPRKAFTPASSDALLHALIDFQYGRTPGAVPLPTPSKGYSS
jgi:hypothetical protein